MSADRTPYGTYRWPSAANLVEARYAGGRARPTGGTGIPGRHDVSGGQGRGAAGPERSSGRPVGGGLSVGRSVLGGGGPGSTAGRSVCGAAPNRQTWREST